MIAPLSQGSEGARGQSEKEKSSSRKREKKVGSISWDPYGTL